MARSILCLLAFFAAFFQYPVWGQELPVEIIFNNHGETISNGWLTWNANQNVSYEVQRSNDLLTWTKAPGYPNEIDGSFGSYQLTNLNEWKFYRIIEVDSEGPTIPTSSPYSGAFGIKRNSSISFLLEDPSGVDMDTVSFSIGSLGTFDLEDSEVSEENGAITFSLGEVVLGEFGSNLEMSITASDLVGNAATRSISFQLEVEPIVSSNIFVFGSQSAQASGQRFPPNSIASILAARDRGSLTFSATSSTWTLSSIEPERITIAYTGNDSPNIEAGAFLANSAPSSAEEIFYRRALSVTNDAANKTLTILTEDVALADMIQQGTSVIDQSSIILIQDNAGHLVQAVSGSFNVDLPRMGFSLDGSSISLSPFGVETETGDDSTHFVGGELSSNTIASLDAEELHFWLYPRVNAGIAIGLLGVEKFNLEVSGRSETAALFKVGIFEEMSLERKIFELPRAASPEIIITLPPILGVPVFLRVGLNFSAYVTAVAKGAIEMSFGAKKDFSSTFGFDFDRSRDPLFRPTAVFTPHPTEVKPVTMDILGEVSVQIRLSPTIEKELYGAVGVATSITPYAGFTLAASDSEGCSGTLELGADLEFSPSGAAFRFLEYEPKFSFPIFEPLSLKAPPNDQSLTIVVSPQDAAIQAGGHVRFQIEADSQDSIDYQWFQNGIPIPGQTNRKLDIYNVGSNDVGFYHAEARSGCSVKNSEMAELTIVPDIGTLDIVIAFTSGPHSGQEFEGSVKYSVKEAVTINTGYKLFNPSSGFRSLSFTIDGTSFSIIDDEDYPTLPRMFFNTQGNVTSLDYLGVKNGVTLDMFGGGRNVEFVNANRDVSIGKWRLKE